MIIIELMTAIIGDIFLGSVITVSYVKLLSVLIPHLLKKIGYPRTDSRKNSSIEVGCIYCFDKAYYFSYSCISHISGVIKSYVGHKHINKYRHNGGRSSGKES